MGQVPSKDAKSFQIITRNASDISSLLPDVPIRVYGPPTTSGIHIFC